MDLKTLVEHFPGQSIQTNSVPEPSSPRRGHFISARSWLSHIKPGFFSMWKPYFLNSFLYSLHFYNIVPSWVYGLLICSEEYFQIAFCYFSTNEPDLLWSQNLFTIYDFHIEKIFWGSRTPLGVCRPKQASPGRGWLRDTICLNR